MNSPGNTPCPGAAHTMCVRARLMPTRLLGNCVRPSAFVVYGASSVTQPATSPKLLAFVLV
eukprot:8378439-Heterocapsa_arctica.AAC.1